MQILRATTPVLCAAAALLFLVVGCRAASRSHDAAYAASIQRVVDVDIALGAIRNDATLRTSVGQASLDYAASIEAIDFTATPPEFRDAYLRHAEAWRSLGNELLEHPRADRHLANMNKAISLIRAENPTIAPAVQDRLDLIWSTWNDIERLVRRFSVETD